jgi:hypothetical protein
MSTMPSASQAFDSKAANMNSRLEKVLQAEALPGGSASTLDNHTRIEEKARTESHDISILERRVFALETFLGSSSNTFNIEAAGTQHAGLGLGSQEDSGTISGSGTLPLIDSISRWLHYTLHISSAYRLPIRSHTLFSLRSLHVRFFF